MLDKIYKLPIEIKDLIKDYINKINLVFTNRENYNIYHKIIKKYIVNYDNYIRNTIRRDNSFVLYEIF